MLKFVIAFLSVLYPLTIVFMPKFTVITQVLLVVFSALAYLFLKDVKHLYIGIFFVIVLFLQDLKYLYPVFVNLIFFMIFFFSLKTTPIITKIASLKEDLDEKAKKYTRNLTIIWMYFFVINGLISFALSLLDDKSFWAIYCGIVSYILIGALFVVELMYRRFVLKV